MKPYNEADIQGILQEIQLTQRSSTTKSFHAAPIKLAMEDGSIKYLSPKDIVYISTEGKNVLVHSKDETYETN